MSSFEVVASCAGTQGRAGKLTLPHGVVETPVYMPVGTQATVKMVTPEELHEMEAPIILGNAYHLFLRPGSEVMAAAGGLHRFMSWDKPILTDSGGFQVFSLAHLRKIEENGVEFRSHVDGSLHTFTPESSVGFQLELGSDIVMCFDECAPYPCEEDHAQRAMERTLRWAKRCRDFWDSRDTRGSQLFGIVQGATFPELRRESAQRTVEIGFPGYAIGGLSVGEPKDVLHEMLETTVPFLPIEKPRYLMGVGKPEDLWEGVDRGIDMFDCVLATRNARNGQIFTFEGKYNIRNAGYRQDFTPLEEGCPCPACRNFTRAYICHLFRAGENLGQRLATLHNLRFMIRSMRFIRQSLMDGTFPKKKEEFLNRYMTQTDEAAV